MSHEYKVRSRIQDCIPNPTNLETSINQLDKYGDEEVDTKWHAQDLRVELDNYTQAVEKEVKELVLEFFELQDERDEQNKEEVKLNQMIKNLDEELFSVRGMLFDISWILFKIIPNLTTETLMQASLDLDEDEIDALAKMADEEYHTINLDEECEVRRFIVAHKTRLELERVEA